MARSSTARGKGGVRFLGEYGEEVGRCTTRGFLGSPSHINYREDWRQRPALKAVLELAGAGADSAATLLAYTNANKDFSVYGTNMTTALATFSTGGGITLTTAGANNDQAGVQPQLSTTQTALSAAQFLSQNQPRFKTRIKTGASIAALSIIAGFKLTNTPVIATDDDQAYFRYATSGSGDVSTTNWQFVSSRANVDTVFDTGIPVVASSIYDLEIEIDSGRVPHVFITAPQLISDGLGGTVTKYARQEIALSTAAKAPLTNAIAFIPYPGTVQALTGAAKVITLIPDFEVGHLAA